ncbi:MAG: hypothetical protein DWQ10_00015 [Calditrichaeota bacterium]|nr:MAG: hypothetical protein DWQ10_00015 [Calditrichota bacterium]
MLIKNPLKEKCIKMISFFKFKNICRQLVVFILFVISLPHVLVAQLSQWTTFTAMREVVDFIEDDGTIWAATTGGLLVYSIETDTYESFTNTSGLSSNDITAVALDKYNRVWVAQSNGFIHVFDSESREVVDVIGVYELDNIYINDMTSAGDTMYVALQDGVSEYRIDRDESKEIYRQLSDKIPEESPVFKSMILNNYLYAATNSGLARADLNLQNLKAPQSWSAYTTANGLPSNVIQDLNIFNNNLVIATDAGIALEEGNSITSYAASLPEKDILSLAVKNENTADVLYAASARNIYFSSDLQNWTLLPSVVSSNNQIQKIEFVGDKLWVGFVAKDLKTSPFTLAQYDAGSTFWTTYSPDGPKSKTFNSISYDNTTGILWAASQGIMAYDGEMWHNFEDAGVFSAGDFRKVAVDHQERVWFGHWGNGVYLLEGTPDDFTFQTFDQQGGGLSPISTDSNGDYVVVDEIFVYAAGNVWISNFIPASGRPIAVVTPELDIWQYFSLAEGIRSSHIHAIIEDTRRPGWIWYGSGGVHSGHSGNGVGVIVHNNTLSDKSDDNYVQGFNTDEGLLSLDVRTVAQDQDGTMWFGTPEGLNYWLSGATVSQFIGISTNDKIISTDIKIIKIDAANNKWVGTSSGITVIGPDNNRLTHYTTDNSPIVSNDIKDFAFNSLNGDVYIATTQGLSILSTPFSAPKKDFSKITGYPNPFVIDLSGNTFKFGNLKASSGIRIFTIDGVIVRDYEPGSFSGTLPEWDGRDENDQFVGSGIYFFVGYTDDGDSGIGKIAVIRK